MNDELFKAALAQNAQGRKVLAVKADKRPYGEWKSLQENPQSETDIEQIFNNGTRPWGLAVLLAPYANDPLAKVVSQDY
jgi:hypothetical protein